MRRATKFAIAIMGLILLAPVLALALFDLVVVGPHWPGIRGLLESAAPAEVSPPATLSRMLRASGVNVSGHVARLMVMRFDVQRRRTNQRQLAELAWWVLLDLHLSDKELTTLFLSQSYMGSVTGFANAAPDVTGVPLSAVSTQQAARLVVFSISPSIYLSKPERLAANTARLLQRADAGDKR